MIFVVVVVDQRGDEEKDVAHCWSLVCDCCIGGVMMIYNVWLAWRGSWPSLLPASGMVAAVCNFKPTVGSIKRPTNILYQIFIHDYYTSRPWSRHRPTIGLLLAYFGPILGLF